MAIYNAILNYILQRGLENYDDFARKLTDKAWQTLSHNKFDLNEILNRIKSSFFRLNLIRRSEFYSPQLEKNIIGLWKRKEFELPAVEKIEVKISEKLKRKEPVYRQVFVDDIDSFAKVRDIKVSGAIYLDIPEEIVKKSFMEIIGEGYSVKDWGGERSDLFTTHVRYRGRRVPAAFAFKGRGTRGMLTLRKLGKRGDQIIRLFEEPAEIFFLQYNGQIDTSIFKAMEAHASHKSRLGRAIYYCTVDGRDTARILKAYDKLD
jgi:hypothetical protein